MKNITSSNGQILLMSGLLFCQFIIATMVTAQSSEYFRIGNVQESWLTYPGSIDKATIFITPKGLYAECQLFLDFSVKCTQFTNPADSLEIQMGFNLPKEAEVVDLWLWVGSIPVRAGIYDRWTASQIYEDIVDRRMDPALLLKNSDTFYDLRIFPLMVNLPRKIKMTFLLPFNKLTGYKSLVQLPLNILKLSQCPVDTIRVAYKNGFNLSNPKLLELPQNIFSQQYDTSFGGIHNATIISSISTMASLNLSLDNSTQNSSFLTKYPVPDSNYGIYQLEMNLAQLLGVPQKKKTLFLMDFLSSNSSLTKTQVLQTMKSYISTYFEAGDSINFMFSGLYTTPFSNSWIPADPGSLSQIFNSLDTTYLKNYTNLPSLLIDGINFIKSTGNNGNIVLISSSANFTNSSDANTLLNNTLAFMGQQKFPVHTIYLDDKSYMTYYGNTNYRGNEYLYSNLSMLTGGEYQTILTYTYTNDWWWYYYVPVYDSFENLLGNLLPKLTGYFSALNVYPMLQSGFTFADYNVSSVNGFTYFGSPFRRVGKYTGEFPMNVIISAQTPDGQLYNTQISIDSTGIFSADSVSQNIWAAHHLREMLSFTQTNTVVYQIVHTSINERVLTKYTAFLALEPGMVPPDTIAVPAMINGGIGTNGWLNIDKPDTVCNDFSFYPNPVSATSYFEFTLQINSSVDIDIYNLHGQKVSTVVNQKMPAGHEKIPFDTGILSEGIYFYRVSVNGQVKYSGKLVKTK